MSNEVSGEGYATWLAGHTVSVSYTATSECFIVGHVVARIKMSSFCPFISVASLKTGRHELDYCHTRLLYPRPFQPTSLTQEWMCFAPTNEWWQGWLLEIGNADSQNQFLEELKICNHDPCLPPFHRMKKKILIEWIRNLDFSSNTTLEISNRFHDMILKKFAPSTLQLTASR